VFQKYFFIANYLIIVIFGIYHYQKIKESLPLKLFLGFLVYSFITEIVGTLFAFYLRINSAIIYNTWNIVNFLFFTFFFYSILKSAKRKKIVLAFAGLFSLFIILNAIFFENYMVEIFRNNIIFGKILMMIIIMMYFTELLKSNLILNLGQTMFFWVSLGVFVYAIGFIPAFVIAKLIDFQGVFRYITIGLNILVSICYITGFIISKKEFNN
jgi:hypothetical protein